ncbi:MAG TPA: serine/threonine-protein kinase [Gemmataceae bacterium]|nr:serine/threonine-protein kinase [Gemmataceae bacterium]
MSEHVPAREPEPTQGYLAPTAAAPTYRPPLARDANRPSAPSRLANGEQVDDFEIVDVLGEGGFGTVYLARQLSLDRRVALKVTANRGDEARTLARLEHDHVVTVFSESVDATRGLRLLCMQYVPGTTLQRIIRALGERDRKTWCGQAVLDVIDEQSMRPAAFHPAALRDRELLARADYFEAVCWIGARLAEAIDYAHAQGVLHRDVKPGNVLVNPYGRPLLADFNVAVAGRRESDRCGGTLAYMAPEHLDAFNPETASSARPADERSDIYSLGVVLYEMLTVSRPFTRELLDENACAGLRAMAEERRCTAPSPRREWADVPALLDHAVRRCLDADPGQRYQTGEAIALALEGCRAQRHLERELPRPGRLTRAALRRPFLWLAVLALVPQAIGSFVNISYNALNVADSLRPDQQAAFARLVIGYNLVVYPACLAILLWLVVPVLRAWRRLRCPSPPTALPRNGREGRVRSEPPVDDIQVSTARRRALSWPAWSVGLACAGWLPGGLVFTLGIHLLAGPVGATVFGHFLVSFTISGLIALTYSYLGVEFLVLRVLYPGLWADAGGLRRTMGAELAGHGARLRLFQLSAGVIPLIGAVLLLAAGSDVVGAPGFRFLITALLCAGMAGFGLALFAGNRLTRIVALYANTSVP